MFFNRITAKDVCVNAYEVDPFDPGALDCGNQLMHSPVHSCQVPFLTDKGCDKECNLCACSTGSPTSKFGQHCNGRGTCKVSRCTKEKCFGAYCECNEGYGGRQCELGNSVLCLNLFSENPHLKQFHELLVNVNFY